MKKSKFDIVYESIMNELICEDGELFTVDLDWADEKKPVAEGSQGGGWPTVTFKGTKENLEKLVKDWDPTKAAEVEFKQA